MNGKAAGAGLPIVFGAYLLYSHLPKSKLFQNNSTVDIDTALSGLGLLLLLVGLIFLIKNLK